MTQFDLRPLTIGEILNRTFALYQQHFLLFIGITAVPQLIVLACQFIRIFLINTSGGPRIEFSAGYLLGGALVSLVILLIAFLATAFSQGATIFAVSDLYLNKPIQLSDCLRRAWAEIGTVFVVGLLNGLAILAGTLALVIPGFYILCRLIVATPGALIEGHGPRGALSRSWNLTRNNAGRALVLVLIFFVLSLAVGLLLGAPFSVVVVASRNDPGALRLWTALTAVVGTLANILVIPILLITTCLFYFDLRARQEGLDAQLLAGSANGPVPSVL